MSDEQAPPDPKPCADLTPQPETDVQFKLEKVIATMRAVSHLPERGSVN